MISSADHGSNPPAVKKSTFITLRDYLASNLDVILPPTLVCCAAICWYDPSRFPSLMLGLSAAAYILAGSLIKSSKQEAVRNISDGVTHSLVEFSRDPKQSEPLIGALSQTIRVALTNEELTSTFKDVVINSMRNEQLQSDILDTLSGAILRASEDTNLKSVLLSSIQQALSDALNDKGFLDTLFASLSNVIVSATENTALRETIMNVTAEAVSLALQDERFLEELKLVLKECLRDGDIYRAGAAGLVGAVLPRKKS